MKKLLLFLVLASTYAFSQFPTTPNLGLQLPPFGTINWNVPVNNNFNLIDAAVGNVQSIFQGSWLSTVTYSKGQIVNYLGILYISLTNANVNNTPSLSPSSWSIFFQAVNSINSTSGAFTFSGSGVSCTGTTCTFTSSSGVSSVSNSDGTISISPTVGAAVVSLNLNHANTWSASQTFIPALVDFSGTTQIKLPVAAGYASAANGETGYDTTGQNWHIWGNGVDNLNVIVPASVSITNNDCARWSKAGNVITISDAGSPCSSGTVTSVTGDGTIITNSASTGAVTLTIAGTSGGIPYFSSSSAWASSAVLTANGIVLGGGAATAPKTVAGIVTDGISHLTLGVAGTSVGQVIVNNLTSGTITIAPPTGALGTVTNTLPASNTTLAGLAVAETFTALQTFSAGINLSGTTSPLQLAGTAGSSGNCMISGGTGVTPSWGSCSGLTIQTNSTNNSSQTNLNLINSSTNAAGLSLTQTNTTAGTVQGEVSGTLNIAHGGTNATSAAAGTVPNATTGTASSWTTSPTLGASGTAGSITMGNATSGLLTLQPVTGALGTVTASLPANTGTIAETNLAETFSALQTFSAGINLSGTTSPLQLAGAAGSSGQCLTSGGAGATPSWSPCSSSSALSAITAATATNTIANGNNPQTWNWAQTTNSQTAFTFGETTAATGTGDQELAVTTLAGSTAIPLVITDSLTGSQTVAALKITPTWNTTGVVDAGILENVTNTASGTGSLLIDLQVGGTSEFTVDKTGKGQFGTGTAGQVTTAGFISGGTKFTTSGCSVSSTTGGATAGKMTLGANTCSVVITMNGATGLTAPNGWSCRANDETTAAGNASLYFSTNNTTTATLSVPAAAGTTDVVDFSCIAF